MNDIILIVLLWIRYRQWALPPVHHLGVHSTLEPLSSSQKARLLQLQLLPMFNKNNSSISNLKCSNIHSHTLYTSSNNNNSNSILSRCHQWCRQLVNIRWVQVSCFLRLGPLIHHMGCNTNLTCKLEPFQSILGNGMVLSLKTRWATINKWCPKWPTTILKVSCLKEFLSCFIRLNLYRTRIQLLLIR